MSDFLSVHGQRSPIPPPRDPPVPAVAWDMSRPGTEETVYLLLDLRAETLTILRRSVAQ